MRVLPPPEGLVTVRDSGELHITPLAECPKCLGPLPYLSINNGFTGKEDTGKLQQWVSSNFVGSETFRLSYPITQCTPCDLVIFYTEPYTLSDANVLLKRIEERNLATKYNQPPPHQDDFVPCPTSTQSSKGTTQCAKQGCARPRNKECTFTMCKSCCLARPAHEKLCIEHRRRGNSGTVPASRQSRPSIHAPASQLLPPAPPHTPPPSQPNVDAAPTTPGTPRPIFPPPSQQPAPFCQQPEIQDRVAAPREGIHRRRGGRSVNSNSDCTIHIWVEVCPGEPRYAL